MNKTKSILILISTQNLIWPNETYKFAHRVQWYDEHYISYNWYRNTFQKIIKIEYSDGEVYERGPNGYNQRKYK